MKSYAVSVTLAIAGSALALGLHLPCAHAQAPGITNPVPPPAPLTHYTEFRVAIGGGSTSSGKRVGDDDEGTVDLNLSVVRRDDSRVIGANLNAQSTLWGADHFYAGGVLGFALGSGGAHLELLGEAGIHHLKSLGSGIFTPPPATEEATADLFYAGAQLRAVFDLGEPGGLELELTAQGRTDLSREKRDLDGETWTLGGTNTSVLAGLSFAFDD